MNNYTKLMRKAITMLKEINQTLDELYVKHSKVIN